MRLDGRNIVLGISGGIAAYKGPELVRRLRDVGAQVRVVLTRNAMQFVSPLALQSVAGTPVASELFDLDEESRIGHIRLADEADVVLVAPATANLIAKMTVGLADDLLTTVLLATRAPVVLAPAMNVHMLANAIVRTNLNRLEERGVRLVSPDSGLLACGYEGQGRLPDPPVLIEALCAALTLPDLAAEVVLVTAGPTRERLDPVRFLSNRSSGRMGFEIARAARRRGARVVLVAGPTALAAPQGVEIFRVESADEMAEAVREKVAAATVVIAAAAVADYRPSVQDDQKQAKVQGDFTLRLMRTPDVIATVVPRRPGLLVVGFAAETHAVIERARAKLERKNLDLIVANDVTAVGAGFDVETNIVTLIDRQGARALPCLPKAEVADSILDWVVAARRGFLRE